MGSEYCELSSLLAIKPRNGLYKSAEFQGEGNRWIKMSNIYGTNFFTDQSTELIAVTESELEKFSVQTGDLLFGRTSLTLEGVGDCMLIGDIADTPIFESNLFRLRFNEELASPAFYYYFFKSPAGKQLIQKIAKQTAATSITASDLIEQPVPYLSRSYQDDIANFLSTLDNKIELNRQMNATLEAMAQTLFKSWFVDFDPVIDNALTAGNDIPEPLQAKAAKRQALGETRNSLPKDIQQQFPDRFVLTEEMGWVPEGWEPTSLDVVIELAYGKSLPAKNRTEGGIPVYGSGGVSGTHNEALVQGPSIVVGRKGTVGSLYWIEVPFFPIDTVFYVVQRNPSIPLYWIYQTLQQIDIHSMGADSAVPGVNRNTLYASRFVLPAPRVLDDYWESLKRLVSKQKGLTDQNQTLVKLRDTLLPKLLSGELRIPDAEKQLAEVI